MTESTKNPLRPEHFRRHDESDDGEFYSQPRLVTHIDDLAIAAATQLYGQALPPGGNILDMCSSWVSHLPADAKYRGVTGLGMNQVELDANKVLTKRVVQDLNADPVLPFADGEFDGAVMTVSVQYLTRPIEVFAEVGRCLAPGAPFIVTYSNRCFPTKAIAAWQMMGDKDHADLIGLYFRLSGMYSVANAYDISPQPKGSSDPLYAVIGRRGEPQPAAQE